MDAQIKVGVLIVKKDEALLIKEWSDNKEGYFWNFVKGTFEPSIDKTLADCAKREAIEEAGVTIKLKSFINLAVKHGFNTRIYVNFIGEITNGEPKLASLKDQKGRNEDIKEVKWMNKEDLKNINKEEFINDIAYEAVMKWIESKFYPLELLVEVVLNN